MPQLGSRGRANQRGGAEGLARKFHDKRRTSLPEERGRTLALPDAQSIEDLTALLTSARALSSGKLPLPDGVGQVGHPLRRLRADRL
jgi:hypothetical protein